MLICSQIHKQMMKRTSFQWADALPPTISKREVRLVMLAMKEELFSPLAGEMKCKKVAKNSSML